MTARFPKLVASLTLAVLPACGRPSSTPGGGVAPGPQAWAGATASSMSVAELRTSLLRFTDLAMREMADASESVRAADPDPAARAFAGALQASVAATSLALAVEPDAEAALGDLMVSISAQRARVEGSVDSPISPAAKASLVEALRHLEAEIWSLGEGTYPPAELEALRAGVDRWAKAAGVPGGGVVRVADLQQDGPVLSKGLFRPLEEATRQVEETRLLGERFLFLAERLPTVTLWHTEALTWELLSAPESRQALADLTGLSATLADLSAAVDSLPATLTEQRETLLAAFDAREATMHGLLADAGALVSDARSVAESGERILGLSDETAARLEHVLVAADELLRALRDPAAPGGAVSLDVGAYTAALGDFRAAAVALEGALSQAQSVQASPIAWIDHAFWRAVQLLLLVFVLALAYRSVSRLLGRAAS